MSALAKKMMEKYGWKEGEGLGKDREGVKTYVKVTRRDPHTATGLGHAADPAAGCGGAMAPDAHAVALDALFGELQHGGAKASALAKRTRRAEDSVSSSSSSASSSSDRTSEKASSCSSSSSSDDDNGVQERKSANAVRMSDEELFRRCGGVRLGRAGRHRLFQGKLARIESSHKK